ncbi:ABC transporter ATP-binding protein [bacterium]|nr:ABC transporter ATP-binding protein [bacterium]
MNAERVLKLVLQRWIWNRVIRADRLTKRYATPFGEVVALNEISLEIDAGEKLALLGRSGSGKTTLLNILAGLDRATSGSLSVAGRQLADLSQKQLAAYRSTQIGVVFQSFQLIPQRTALQNVELPLIISKVAAAERIERSKQALDDVGLGGRLHHFPYQMSGGEQQRVAIARALIHRPPVLVADEPTGNLDVESAAQVMELMMNAANSSAVTLVIVTHDRLLAERYSNRLVELASGKIVTSTDGISTVKDAT